MDCKNHAGVEAANRCGGCSEPFCPDCLVEIQGKQYCGDCKVLALKGEGPAIAEDQMMPCKEAGSALTYAIVGIFCLGIILEPIAIVKALDAKKKIAANPRLTGAGKAQAALIIAIVSLVLWVLGVIARVSTGI